MRPRRHTGPQALSFAQSTRRGSRPPRAQHCQSLGPPQGSHARLHGDSTCPLAPPNTPSEALPATVALLTITSASHPLAGTGSGRLELSDERTSGPGRPAGGAASLGSTLSPRKPTHQHPAHGHWGRGASRTVPAGMAFVNAAVGGAKLTQ